MRDTQIVSSPVVTVVKISRLVLANKNFSLAEVSPILQAVVQVAVLPVVAMAANHPNPALPVPSVNTTIPPARLVDVQRPSHLFLVKTVPSIVAIASNCNALRAPVAKRVMAVVAVVATAAMAVAAATAVVEETVTVAVAAIVTVTVEAAAVTVIVGSLTLFM